MILLLGAANACGGEPPPNARDAADANDMGRTLPAQGPSEHAILQQLGQLPPGAPRKIGDATVVADPAYHAASGRLCRALSITSPKKKDAEHRLACTEGQAWAFVPDVLGLSSEPPAP